MTDLLDEQHAQVAFGLLAANTNIAHVFDSSVADPTPDPNEGWVLIYTSVAWTRDGIGTGLDAVQDTITTTWNVHCASSKPDAARVLGMQVRDSLIGKRPVIAGRNCGLIKQDDVQPPGRDDSLGITVYDAIANYSFQSTG